MALTIVRRRPALLAAAVVAVVGLAGASTVALAAATGAFTPRAPRRAASARPQAGPAPWRPRPSPTWGGMMQGSAMYGTMRVLTSPASVGAGTAYAAGMYTELAVHAR